MNRKFQNLNLKKSYFLKIIYKLKIFMFKKYLENYMIKIFNFLSKFWIKLNNKIKKKYLD